MGGHAQGRTTAEAVATRSTGPAPEHIELRIWLGLLSCTSRIERFLRQRIRKEFDTSVARFDLLAVLERAPDGLTLSDVSRRLVVSNGAITGLVGKLEAEGMIRRDLHPDDRRTTIIRLTAEGREHFLRMARRHEEWVVSLLGDLTREGKSELLQSLTLLRHKLDLYK